MSTVTLGTLAAASYRLTSDPDLQSGWVVEWGYVVGGDETQVTIYSDGSYRAHRSVTEFKFRVNSGSGYGDWATVLITENDVVVIRMSSGPSARITKYPTSQPT